MKTKLIAILAIAIAAIAANAAVVRCDFTCKASTYHHHSSLWSYIQDSDGKVVAGRRIDDDREYVIIYDRKPDKTYRLCLATYPMYDERYHYYYYEKCHTEIPSDDWYAYIDYWTYGNINYMYYEVELSDYHYEYPEYDAGLWRFYYNQLESWFVIKQGTILMIK